MGHTMFPLFLPFKRKSTYLEKVASPAVLNHAWRLLRKEKGSWVRGLPVENMGHDVVLHIGELARELLAGTYRPGPMRCFEIPKADGTKRLISAPAVRDKLVQRAVLTVLEPLGEDIFHDSSFGFRPKCTREMALSHIRHWVRRGWVWIGDADIKTCFDAIPHKGALAAIRRLCSDRQILRLVKLWIENLPPEFRPVGRDRGLPQGMVLSPFICNLYLHALDCEFTSRNIPFARFADDFVTLSQTQEGARDTLAVAGKVLNRLKLELHPDKTRVIRSAPSHRFLGFRLPNSKERFKV